MTIILGALTDSQAPRNAEVIIKRTRSHIHVTTICCRAEIHACEVTSRGGGVGEYVPFQKGQAFVQALSKCLGGDIMPGILGNSGNEE